MSKKQARKTPIAELDEKLQILNRRRIQAYSSGMSLEIMDQINRLIDETSLELYTQTELERHRKSSDGEDGESFIV
jgi:hypothetical protein